MTEREIVIGVSLFAIVASFGMIWALARWAYYIEYKDRKDKRNDR